MCVCPQGGSGPGGCLVWGVPGPGGSGPGGGPGPGGSGPGGGPGGDPPMASAAGSTHPTGMHSCYFDFVFITIDVITVRNIVAAR